MLISKRINLFLPSCFFQKFCASTSTSYSAAEFTKKPIFPKKKTSETEAQRFVDFKRIRCKGGNGGNGMVSFYRAAGTPFGGPDGGNGGNGSHIILQADSHVRDFSRISNIIKGKNGVFGAAECCHGKNAEHLYVKVPLNTLIKQIGTGEVIHELFKPGEIFIAARGGAGGHGNHFYVSNEVRKPIKAEVGGIGEVVEYDLEMRVMATAGFVGFPNAGKSTLLRAISRAKPKVAAYPFTTLQPHVGMVHYDDFEQVPVADIPGLIDGAHKNVGLGFSFLKHIQRCHCIFYVLDYSLKSLQEQLEALMTELRLYDEKLMEKPSAIVVNKMDLSKNSEESKEIKKMFNNSEVFLISAKQKIDLEPMLIYLRQQHDNYLEEQKNRIEKEQDDYVLRF
uniref:Mitochondrial ribosome-associated GTPase 2 n=1 Tax=Panagrolaimus sp. JU765 TaxID=591449 RepID=A0AC34Q7F5_9BILA